MLPARLFRSRSALAGNGVVFASGIAVDGLLTLATLYAQRVLGLSALVFGMALAVMTITSVGAVWLGQRWVTRRGVRPVAVTGSLLLSAACVAFALTPGGQGTLPVLLAGLLVFGCGMGAAFVAGQIAAVMGAHPDDVGAASGLEETVFTVGGTMGVALVASISLAFAQDGAAQAELAGLHAGFAALAVVTAAGAAHRAGAAATGSRRRDAESSGRGLRARCRQSASGRGMRTPPSRSRASTRATSRSAAVPSSEPKSRTMR